MFGPFLGTEELTRSLCGDSLPLCGFSSASLTSSHLKVRNAPAHLSQLFFLTC